MRDALAYWTPERMAAATPLTGAPAPGGNSKQAAPRLQAIKEATHINGIKTVGILFAHDRNLGDHSCSASVVDSPGHSMILTANHCAHGTGGASIFVPNYEKSFSARDQPYGIWPVQDWFRYKVNKMGDDLGPTSDLDFAFGRVATNGSKKLQDLTGANTVARTPGFNNKNVTVIGYPAVGHNSKDLAVTCTAPTTAYNGYNQMQFLCGGMWGGVSGSPWFSSVDMESGRGTIIGNVGGYYGGGITDKHSSMYDKITYSPMHQDYFLRMYDAAKKGSHTHDNDAYHQPPLPHMLPGSSETWKHAKLTASGDYTGDGRGDLLVVWTDGEVDVYPGDGHNGFGAEQRILNPNKTWTYAKAITGGDFDGGRASDLLVVWKDGETDLYPDVSRANGLREVRMAQPGSTWKYAEQVSGGTFGTGGYTTDLIVRWTDGELSNYTKVGHATFGQEHRLLAPNATWKHATVTTAGDFTGNNNWDLLVRWSDGEVDQYQDTAGGSLGREIRMQNPNSLWQHATVMTAGHYDSNGHPDDALVRWSDGEVDLYPDTGYSWGSEVRLISPSAS